MEPDLITPGLSPIATFLDTKRAARVLGLSRRTLEGLRVSGGGPTFRRHSGRVRYCLADLIAWSEARMRSSTSDHGAVETAHTKEETNTFEINLVEWRDGLACGKPRVLGRLNDHDLVRLVRERLARVSEPANSEMSGSARRAASHSRGDERSELDCRSER